MEHKDFTGVVLAQYTGKEIEAESSVQLKNDTEANEFYGVAKKRLLQINNWHHVAGMISAKFQLVDINGNEIEKAAEKGDYIRIDIPGPGSKEGEGYDWVRIEELKEVNEEDMQSIGIRARPSNNPLHDESNVAHFYDDSATSNFIITREGNKVSALIIDRNVKPNDDTESLTDKIRHTTVGMAAISSFSKIQWQKLAKGFVSVND